MDEPVLEGRLAARGSGLGLAPIIPVGMRAVTVRVNDVTGIAGFVLPGMRVDVLVTGHPPNSDELGHRHAGPVAKHAGAFGRNRDAAGRTRPSHAGADGHPARRRRSRPRRSLWRTPMHAFNWSCETAAIRPSRKRPDATSPNCTANARSRKKSLRKHAPPRPRPRPSRGGGRSAAASTSAARSDRGDSRNAEERGSGGSRRRESKPCDEMKRLYLLVRAAGFGARPVGFSLRAGLRRSA